LSTKSADIKRCSPTLTKAAPRRQTLALNLAYIKEVDHSSAENHVYDGLRLNMLLLYAKLVGLLELPFSMV